MHRLGTHTPCNVNPKPKPSLELTIWKSSAVPSWHAGHIASAGHTTFLEVAADCDILLLSTSTR
jgi:hypothetical protein